MTQARLRAGAEFALFQSAGSASGEHTQMGWEYGNSGRKFAQIDCYVNERLAILASAKHGLQGRNWVSRFNHEWATELGIHRLNGTVKPTLAYASR